MVMVPLNNGGYCVFNLTKRHIEPNLSMVWNESSSNDLLFWDDRRGTLSFIFTDRKNHVYQSILMENLTDNPIQWNGYRNSGNSSFRGHHRPYAEEVSDLAAIEAYAFPNPVSTDEVRIRVVTSFDIESDPQSTTVSRNKASNSQNTTKNYLKIKLFDVTGKIVYDEIFPEIFPEKQDIRINTKNLSSGIYFGTVSLHGSRAVFNLAVEK